MHLPWKPLLLSLALLTPPVVTQQLCGNSVNCEVQCQLNAYHIKDGHFACAVSEKVRYAAYVFTNRGPDPNAGYIHFRSSCAVAAGMVCNSHQGTTCVTTQDDAGTFERLLVKNDYVVMFQNLDDYTAVLNRACK
ncbi:hypothetical protein BJY00DRAFT_314147 [Aspergillus carlsbadensis]|nr:hypothetical protein BJY00DRAFT_314147 [Aspergillus carlsbadensis]